MTTVISAFKEVRLWVLAGARGVSHLPSCNLAWSYVVLVPFTQHLERETTCCFKGVLQILTF